MTTQDYLKIARKYGCSFGRHKPGIYYVTKSDGVTCTDWVIKAKHQREVVKWIEAKFA
jgi:hypothetical protein